MPAIPWGGSETASGWRVLTLADLPVQQRRVALLIAKGYSAARIAHMLSLDLSTVRSYTASIANKIPNPDDISPTHHIMLWAAHQLWLEQHRKTA